MFAELLGMNNFVAAFFIGLAFFAVYGELRKLNNSLVAIVKELRTHK